MVPLLRAPRARFSSRVDSSGRRSIMEELRSQIEGNGKKDEKWLDKLCPYTTKIKKSSIATNWYAYVYAEIRQNTRG